MDNFGEADKYLKPNVSLQEYAGDGKKRVWIVDESESTSEAFLSATIVEQKGDHLIVEMGDRKVSQYSRTSEIRTVPSEQCPDLRISFSITFETGQAYKISTSEIRTLGRHVYEYHASFYR